MRKWSGAPSTRESHRKGQVIGAPRQEAGQGQKRESVIANLPEDVAAVVYSQHRSSCECRQCGRYVGALEVCPFCRHFNRKRASVFLLKYLTPVLTVVGIALLFQLGATRGNPKVKIERLGRRANFAQVQIEGSVTESPRFYRSQVSQVPGAGSLEFLVDDGTGILKIRSYEDVTIELAQKGAIPGEGDRVTVKGTYQFKAKADFLILGAAAALEIHTPEVKEVTLLEHLVGPGAQMKGGTRVRVVGEVQDTRLDQFHWEMSLVDEKQNVIRVELADSVLELFGLKEGDSLDWPGAPGPGDSVSVDGTITWDRFDKRWMITASSPDDLQKVKSAP